jgi:PadR family transcriptional regulator PadR
MGMTKKDIDAINLELRRGVLTLAVLSQLRQEHYGYSLIKQLNEGGLEIDQGTLYPLLRRLEENGLLDSEWRVEGSRPRRYYWINKDGQAVLKALQKDWENLISVMSGVMS